MSDGRAVHVRSIRMESVKVSATELDVTGHLVDERPDGGGNWFGLPTGAIIHDMTLTMRIRYPDLVITRMSGGMASRPYTICTDALEPLQGLVGLSLARGFTRAVNERMGRQQGCAHLTALVQAMAPVVKQAVGGAFRDEREIPRADDMWFVNTCQAWRENGPLHTRLLAGDVNGLRALSARRPPGGARIVDTGDAS
jgi:hypothetical protein